MSKQQKRQKHKANKNNNSVVRPIISSQKRSDLNITVKSLYKITTEPANTPKEEWEQYEKIQQLLQKIMLLENALSPRLATEEKAKAKGISIESLRASHIESFCKWLKDNDVDYDGFCIAEFPGFGLGIQAMRDFNKGDLLYRIPRRVMLNEECLEREHAEAYSMRGMTLSNVKLAYTLILEMLKGGNSFWKPYIDVLPTEYSTVLYFSLEDMLELRGSNVLSLALSHCKVIARQYSALYHCSQNAPIPDMISHIGQIFKEMFCYDLYRWAVATATTRQNLMPKFSDKDSTDLPQTVSTLIPFWDMANHRQGEITSFYDSENDGLASLAESDFKKDEQIFMHYGNRRNAEFMVHNGFICSDNPNDYVSIKMGLSTSDPLFSQRSEVLNWLEIPLNRCEFSVLPAPKYISDKLLAFVRIFNMNEAQLQHWNSVDRARDLLHVDCALETELEIKTWKYLQTRLMLLLRAFPTTLEDDETKLVQYRKGDVKLNYIRAMILEYRISEKRILAEALEYTKQRSQT